MHRSTTRGCMPVRRRNFRLMPLLAGMAFPASANSGIPGPIVISGGFLTVSSLQWVVACMLMCISVEGAVYRYSGEYRRPFLAGAYANTVSLIAGVPLSFLFFFDPTYFTLPAVASIFIEFWAILLARKYFLVDGARPRKAPIIWGNVMTNLIMLGYLIFLPAIIGNRSPLEYIRSLF